MDQITNIFQNNFKLSINDKCRKNNLLQKINKLLESHKKYKIENKIKDTLLWYNIYKSDKNKFIKQIRYLLIEFGTKEPCNRFDVGNTIEYIIGDLLKSIGYIITQLPNQRRIDIIIENKKKLSIKYSSIGNITLHNTNGAINKDMNFTDMLLLTLDKLYLITNQELNKQNINIKNYLINTGDGLKLKRSLLTKFEKINYNFMMKIDLNIDKSQCKNRLCSQLFYEMFLKEYNNLHK
jgi:hypothetical protein